MAYGLHIETDSLLTAKSAIISRLLSCFVNEQLVDAYMVEHPIGIKGNYDQSGDLHWCQVLKIGSSLENSATHFWICLKGMPLTVRLVGKVKVTFLDPKDFRIPIIIRTSDAMKLTDLMEPSVLMNTLAEWNNLEANHVRRINQELSSSVEHLDYAYRHRSNPPKLGDNAIAWEQSIVEGHPTHPMCKTRHAILPIQPISPENNLKTPFIHFFAAPRHKVIITGQYEELIQRLLQKQYLLDSDLKKEIIIPVHEIQIPNIIEKFPFARNLGFSESALAQCSVQTVLIPKTPEVNVKLPIGIIISSILRTIVPCIAQLSPYFKFLTDTVVEENENLIILKELGSIVSNDPNPEMAKHMSCIIREDPDAICGPRDEIVIVCAALTEKEANGMYVVTRAFQLDTIAKRLQFFEIYAKKYLKVFLPPLHKYGIAFEAHLQNTLVRFKKDVDGNYALVGFAARDFGGIEVCRKQFKEATGFDIKFGACEILDNEEESNRVGFHVMIRMHLHYIIRALDLHYSGIGWAILRRELDAVLPKNCTTRKMWLESDTVLYKCFVTMKFLRPSVQYWCKIPNLIKYSPEIESNSTHNSNHFKSSVEHFYIGNAVV